MRRSAGHRRSGPATWVVVALWVGGTLVLAGAAFVGAFLAGMKGSLRSSAVEVPDLVSRTVDEAREIATRHGLAVEVTAQRYDPLLHSGKVVEHEPPAGFPVRRGRTVKLTVSLGSEVMVIPRVVGRGDREIVIELQRAGLVPGDVSVVRHPTIREGRVLAQVPPPGSPALPGTRVHRLVSAGPASVSWVMPDLVGLGREDAERWLRWSGFRLGPVREVPAEGRALGTVVGQFPLSGYPVRRTDVVEISVAR